MTKQQQQTQLKLEHLHPVYGVPNTTIVSKEGFEISALNGVANDTVYLLTFDGEYIATSPNETLIYYLMEYLRDTIALNKPLYQLSHEDIKAFKGYAKDKVKQDLLIF